jgi:hypothetical protein
VNIFFQAGIVSGVFTFFYSKNNWLPAELGKIFGKFKDALHTGSAGRGPVIGYNKYFFHYFFNSLFVRGREAERQRGKEAERQRGREAEMQRDKDAERQRDKEAERQRGKEAKMQRSREAKRQRNREAKKQRGRDAERQRCREILCID